MRECGGQRTLSTYSLESSTLYFETGPLIGLQLLEQAGWSVSPGGASCLCLPSAWITYVTLYGQHLLYMGHGKCESDAHTCTGQSPEPSRQPCRFLGTATPFICVSVSAFLFCCVCGHSIRAVGLFHTLLQGSGHCSCPAS